MAANDREFTLIGKFDDRITQKLKDLNKLVKDLSKPLGPDNFTKSILSGITDSTKEVKNLQRELDKVRKVKMDFDRSDITAAIKETESLGKTVREVEKAGLKVNTSGLKEAQQEALTLGKILEANALIQVGEGFANALVTGASAAVGILQSGLSFLGGQFAKGAQDQLEDIQARGSLFGTLQAEGLFKSALEGKEGKALQEAMSNMYLRTKDVTRSMEGAINEVIRTSTVSSEVIQILSRQLGDNLLPAMLKEKKVTDLSQMSREELEKVMGGPKGVATELATLYSQIASIIPNPSYAPIAAMGFSQFLGSGRYDRNLTVFQSNPVLTKALDEGLIKFGNTVTGRIEAVRYALSVAMPEQALEEAKNTIAGGWQSINDTLLGPSGILTLTADVTRQGEKTLEIMTRSGARAIEIARNEERNAALLKRYIAGKNRTQEEIQAYEKNLSENHERFIKRLDDFYKSADSPIEVLATQFGPLMQSFANMINNAGNLFIGPITSMVEAMAVPIARLKVNFDNLGSNLLAFVKGDKDGIQMSFGEVLGRAFAEIFKTLAEYFNPEKAGKEIGGGIQQFFKDFEKGFKGGKVKGDYYLNLVLKSLEDIIMSLLFVNKNPLEGMTPLGDALLKIFALLAAPAFILSVVSGVIPLVIAGFGQLIVALFKGVAGSREVVPEFPDTPAGRRERQRWTRQREAAELARREKAERRKKALERLRRARERKRLERLKKLPKPLRSLAKLLPMAPMGLGALGAGGAGGAAGGAAAGAGAAAGGIAATVLSIVLIVAILTAAFVMFETPIRAFADSLYNWGTKLTNSKNWAESAFGHMLRGASILLSGFTDFFTGLWLIISGMFSGDSDRILLGIRKLFDGIGNTIKGTILFIGGLGGIIIGAIGNLFRAIAKGIADAWKRWRGEEDEIPNPQAAVPPRPREFPGVGTQTGVFNMPSVPPPPGLPSEESGGFAFGSANPFYGTLSEAINFEMAHKPPGSHLVIANSSETIIPAAGGFGDGVEGIISAIWGAAQNTVRGIQDSIERGSNYTNSVLNRGFSSSQQISIRAMEVSSRQNEQLMLAIRAAAATGGFMGEAGLAGGAGYGGRGVQLAGMLGNFIRSTGGAPGSIWEHPWHGGVRGRHARNSYHYSGRAIDIGAYANEQAGVIARIQEFNRRMGVRPVEFLHAGNDPNHQDHVHVAYALGEGRPAFFSSQTAAENWERKMIPASLRVRTITTNSGEASFGSPTLNAPITIYQQPNQNAEELASMVAIRIGMAIEELRNHV